MRKSAKTSAFKSSTPGAFRLGAKSATPVSSTLVSTLAAGLLLASCLAFTPAINAEERRIRDLLKPSNLVKPSNRKKPAARVQPNQLVADPSPRLSSEAAAALVRAEYAGSRILSVSLLDDEEWETGVGIYRVRTLSKKGVVRSVFVDGDSGEVFE